MKSPKIKLKEEKAGSATILAFTKRRRRRGPLSRPRSSTEPTLPHEGGGKVLRIADYQNRRVEAQGEEKNSFGYFPGYGYYYAYWMWVPMWKIS